MGMCKRSLLVKYYVGSVSVGVAAKFERKIVQLPTASSYITA